MGTALGRVDVVGEGEDRLVVGRVPLQRHLDRTIVSLVLEEDDAGMDGVLLAVDVGDEVADAALVVEDDALALGALVVQFDAQAFGEEGRLAQALRQDPVVVVDVLEDVGVGHEGHRGACGGPLLELLVLLEPGDRDAALIALAPVVPLDVDVELEPLREGVDDRDADAVQAARDLVAGPAELAAGVKHGKHHLGRRLPVLLHDPHGDTAAVVDHSDGVIGVDGHRDRAAVARQGFVD